MLRYQEKDNEIVELFGKMADQIAAQFLEEFKKVQVRCKTAADVMVSRADSRENEMQSKFQKYLEAKSKFTKATVSLLELSKEHEALIRVKQEIDDAKELALKVEKREEAKVEDLEKKAMEQRKILLDFEKGENMRDLYEDMLEKLAEMQTGSRQSQKDALTNERLMLEEQVALLSAKSTEMRAEVERLTAALDATGYEGLLHETRRSLMVSVKDEYTKIKNELLRLRLATHALRIRARTAQANSALEK
ncbi:hypothetical protein GCK32_005804 [Trichostrongylus colubriformis]|uniref:Uncharacterized protein n=1 Tax=Trichostrongylus colubriformis TaxID=6319 RepID=A0AAN8FQX8_TRICO